MENKIQIVKIIDDYHVVINAGSNIGIEPGVKFKILDKEKAPVHDPESGELLGFLDAAKDYIKAKEVQEKMTICESLRTVDIDFAFFPSAMPSVGKKRLNVDTFEITGGEDTTDALIKVGDEVKRIS
ncbi:hypothetical protein ACW0TQ_07920 [Oceanobacillus sp. M60]